MERETDRDRPRETKRVHNQECLELVQTCHGESDTFRIIISRQVRNVGLGRREVQGYISQSQYKDNTPDFK